MTRQEKITYLLSNPDKLLMKKPFYRGGEYFAPTDGLDRVSGLTNNTYPARLPRVYKTIISQERFMLELDPQTHEVMFDTNLPSICVKLGGRGRHGGGYQEINYKRMGLAFQERIRQKQSLSLCGNPIQFTLRSRKTSEKDAENYAGIKEAWVDRNQDGMIFKSVYTQLGLGDVGLLYYHNEKGEIKSRVLSYEDGYVIISHNDDNGERVMECVYYADAYNVEHIDCYTDTHVFRMTNERDWSIKEVIAHNFGEIPLVTKRGNVGWNDAQSIIESFETLYNIYLVVQKRHGWGILYVRGRLNETVKKIAGSILLNDTSVDGNGSAEFKTPPTPQGVQDLLKDMFKQIQIAASCTFLLPEDIHSSGDVSGVAVQLTQQLDIEGAANRVIDWQNFVDKCVRLFKRGYAIELIRKGDNPTAVTDFDRLNIGARFKIWRPFSEAEYNQMLATLKGAGVLSKKTAIEKNTVSQPDEAQRVAIEEEEARKLQEIQMQHQQQRQRAESDTQDPTKNNPKDE